MVPTSTIPVFFYLRYKNAESYSYFRARGIQIDEIIATNTHKFPASTPMTSSETECDDILFWNDSTLILNLLPESLAVNAFSAINNEVIWSEMSLKGSTVPRLVCIHGDISNEQMVPIYRHPADFQPHLTGWTPTTDYIRDVICKRLNLDLNHVLIQLYRSGYDCIGEHSDKTLDIKRGSSIVTFSLGAQRTLILRSKLKTPKDSSSCSSENSTRDIWKIPLPHNSLFILGSMTNKHFVHSIKEDKRSLNLKTTDELAFDGQRISLTFRCISTFFDRTSGQLSGQGAPKEIGDSSSSKLNVESNVSHFDSDTEEVAEDDYSKLLTAFSAENKLIDFDWGHYYGSGFKYVGTT